MISTAQSQKKIFFIFIGLFLLFAVPLTIASWMVVTKKALPLHMTHHGHLIQPSLNAHLLQKSEPQKAQWSLLYVMPQPICDVHCEKTLYNMRQINIALGKDMDRVHRAILTLDSFSDEHLDTRLKTNFSGTLHLKTTQHNFRLFSNSDPYSQKTSLSVGGIYMIDPLGNVMLFYNMTSDPMNIFKDLTHLLQFSHIG